MLAKTFKAGSLEIPALGVGTLQLRGAECYQCLEFALNLGYKYIDSSPSYFNEQMIAIALAKSSRSSVFLSSKVSSGFYAPERSELSLKSTLSNLKLDYIDLYMLEWPNPKKTENYSGDSETIRKIVWESLISYKKKGLVKHIGVCDFKLHHIQGLYEYTKVWPEAIIIEANPFHFDLELIEFCKKKNIQVISRSPLCRGNKVLFQNLDIVTIAKRNGVSPAQVILRWIISKNISTVVKSSSYTHIRQNSMLDFELSPEDIKIIDKIEKVPEIKVRY